MGKNLIQQRRGKGSSTFAAPSFRYAGKIQLPPSKEGVCYGEIVDIIHSTGHYSPLALVYYEDGEEYLIPSHEGAYVGEQIQVGVNAEVREGNVLPLSKIPGGSFVFNIEKTPGDGGKFVRSSGSSAQVLEAVGENVLVILPSKKTVMFGGECRAVVGVIGGSQRLEKPLLKGGVAMHKYNARNRVYPIVKGVAMNATNHPHGGTRTSHTGRPRIAPHNAPPGRKVGAIRPRRTGKVR